MTVIQGASEELRFDASRDWALFGLGGTLIKEQNITQNGRKGREQIIEVKDTGFTRIRGFWVGRRLYLVLVGYQERFLIPEAVDFFLESFQVEEPRLDNVAPAKQPKTRP
jgi:hypothetical protein